MSESDAAEKAKLEAKLAGLEWLREDLDPAIYRARRDEYESRLATLDQTGGGAMVAGHVTTGGGDFIGRDKIDIRIEAGAYRGTAPQTRERRLAIYRAVLAARTGDLPLRGFDPEASDASSTRSDLSLAGVYISLDTRLTATQADLDLALAAVRAGRTPAPLRPSAPGPGGSDREAAKTRAVTALESAVLHRALVLLGSPGSGKTTFVHYLAHALATGEVGRLRDWPEADRGALPILVVLRDLAAWLAGPGGATGGAAGRRPSPALLWDFVRYDLQERNLAFAADLLAEALDAGQALVLLDGLDEVPAGTLATVRDSIDAFAGRYRGCRYLVTCRVLSYREPEWRLPETTFPPIELAPFDAGQVDAFIGAWYAEVAARWQVSKAEADRKADTLRAAVRRPDLWRLAANPMLLTVMALVNTHLGELPGARARLYLEAVNILLWRWERQKQCGRSNLGDLLAAAGRDRGDLLSLLERLAFEAHERGAAAAGEGTGDTAEAVADIGELDLLKALQPLHPQRSLDWAGQVVAALKLRAGLLIETQPGTFSLPHRTFQEYLAGAHLARQGNFAQRALDLVEGRGWWREVILLAVGDLVHNQRENERPLFLAHRLCPPPDPAQKPIQEQTGPADAAAWRRVWLAGDVLLEVGLGRVGDTDFGRDMLDQVRTRLAELVAGGWLEARERAEAGDVLGRLGDPRFDPQYFHLPSSITGQDQAPLGLIRIAPGPFVMGSRQGDKGADDDEYGNPPSLAIDYPYWISSYPVTVDQFRCFVTAGGYDDPQWWTAQGWDWRTGRYDTKVKEDWLKDWLAGRPVERRGVPFRWAEQASSGNRPITGVCWFEAMAYARWLDVQVQARTRDWAPGYVLRLPTEGEWEKAARGTAGWVYAWGDAWDPQRANVEGAIGRPTAVGMYPQGRHRRASWTRPAMCGSGV